MHKYTDPSVHVTLSIGIHTYVSEDLVETSEDLVETSVKAMFQTSVTESYFAPGSIRRCVSQGP